MGAPAEAENSLPIDSVLPEIVSSLRACPNLVLRAPTGAGKTTRVPLAIWRSGLCGEGWVVLVEPRRLAARAACTHMARQLSSQPGDLIGYQVRHEKRLSNATRVVAMTPGILLGRLVDDPTLEGIGAIVLDESSILKSYDGKTRSLLINTCKQVPFRLAASATPTLPSATAARLSARTKCGASTGSMPASTTRRCELAATRP